MSSGSIEVGVSQTRKGASSKTASKPAPQKSTSKPGNTKKKQNAKQRMAEQLSMSSDLSLSGSIELDDDDPPPRAPVPPPPPPLRGPPGIAAPSYAPPCLKHGAKAMRCCDNFLVL